MTNIYRATRYPDHDMVFFTGTPQDLAAIRELGFLVKEVKRETTSGYDVEYYVWARDDYRVEPFAKLMQHLKQSYQSPTVEMSIFPAEQTLPDDRPPEDWRVSISAAVRQHFADLGYPVFLGAGVQVMRQQTKDIAEVKVYEGVEYHVLLDPDWRPWLLCDFVHRFFLNGEPASYERIKQRYPQDSIIAKEVHAFVTRSTDELFEWMTRFVKTLDQLPLANGIRFSPEPTSARDAGFDTWFWLHDTDTALAIGNGLETNLAQTLETDHTGLYTPIDDVQVVLLYPNPGTQQLCVYQGWSTVCERLLPEKVAALLADAAVPIASIAYCLDNPQTTVAEYLTIVQSCRRPLVVMFAPPKWARDSRESKWQLADQQAFQLQGMLREHVRSARGYVVTLDWTVTDNPWEIEYVLSSGLLKGLFVLGSQHWIVKRMPVDGLDPSDVCFIGLDAAPRPPRLGGTIFDAQGVWHGYHIVHSAGRGEYTSAIELARVIEKLLGYFERNTKRWPRHLIVHRDGLLRDELAGFTALAEREGFTFDLVEVTKGGAPRLRQPGNVAGTPSAEIAVGRPDIDLAYLVNTRVVPEKRGAIWPAPKAIRIHRVDGVTSLKTLAAQVFWLSRMHFGSYHRSVGLPVTTAYADVLVGKMKKHDDWGSHIETPYGIPFFL